jgi:hypothetical protein
MRLRWTTPAAQDLYNIVRRIQLDSGKPFDSTGMTRAKLSH